MQSPKTYESLLYFKPKSLFTVFSYNLIGHCSRKNYKPRFLLVYVLHLTGMSVVEAMEKATVEKHFHVFKTK